MTLFGWDASNFDWSRGPMDLAAAYRDGVRFFTHKATEGTSIRHSKFGTAMNRANSAGIPFLGAYHVVRTPGNGGAGSVSAQVDYFLRYADEVVPWWRDHDGWFWQVDLEHWAYDTVAPGYGAQMCDILEARTDRRALLYAPKWAYGDSIPGDAPLWASQYVKGDGAFRALYPGDGAWPGRYSGRVPVIWQYTSHATIGGQPTCDANAFRGDAQAFAELIGGDMGLTAEQAKLLNDIGYTLGVGDPAKQAGIGAAHVWRAKTTETLTALLAGVQGDTDAAQIIAAIDAKFDEERAQTVAEVVAALSPLLQSGGPVSRDDLEAALRKVLGSVDEAV